MKHRTLYPSLLLTAANALAEAPLEVPLLEVPLLELPLDGFHAAGISDGDIPYFIVEDHSLQSINDYLQHAICKDGTIQSPAPITDLHAFFQDHPVMRIIDLGNGHYLLTRSIEPLANQHFGSSGSGSLDTVSDALVLSDTLVLYAELDVDSPTAGTFTIRAASAFFTGEGMLASTCLAGARYDLDRTNS